MKVEEKKRAFEEWLQCNSMGKYERYKVKNVKTKRKVEEAKMMSNFKWGQDFDRSYEENKLRRICEANCHCRHTPMRRIKRSFGRRRGE